MFFLFPKGGGWILTRRWNFFFKRENVLSRKGNAFFFFKTANVFNVQEWVIHFFIISRVMLSVLGDPLSYQ